MEETALAVGAIVFMVLGFFALISISVILNGYALSILWQWFMVPIFAAPQLSVAQAIGVAMVISFITYQATPTDKDSKWWEGVVWIFAKPGFALLIGYVVKQFM